MCVDSASCGFDFRWFPWLAQRSNIFGIRVMLKLKNRSIIHNSDSDVRKRLLPMRILRLTSIAEQTLELTITASNCAVLLQKRNIFVGQDSNLIIP
jgi:hypothetical protein